MTGATVVKSRSVRVLLALVLAMAVTACSEPRVIAPLPGEQWVGPSGEVVSSEVLALYASDCPAWPGAGFLELGPEFDVEVPETRRYARDPEGSLPTVELLAPYDSRGALSREARFTGYETDSFMLFLGEDQDIYAYLVDGPRVEALPLVESTLLCP
jgi:hypothetical protein